MELTNSIQKKFSFRNLFHALNSLSSSEKKGSGRAKYNTDALINIFARYNKTADKDWLEGIIEFALEEKDEAKQIYELAETIRIEYIEQTITDVDKIGDLIRKYVSKDNQYDLFLIIDYLMSSLYEIDLYDVAKELVLRYRDNRLFVEENQLSK